MTGGSGPRRKGPRRFGVVECWPSAEDVAHAGASRFERAAASAIAARGRFVVSLSGGSTPRRMLALLAEEPFRSRVDWSRVVFTFGDERTVPPDHADSNFKMAQDQLFSRLALRDDQVHRIAGEQSDSARAADAYARALAELFDRAVPDAPPRLDLVYLGMGDDGHTASLFPGTEALAEEQKWVVSNRVPQLDTTRITMTMPLLSAAREIVFLVCGASKADRMAQIFGTDVGVGDAAHELPAARLQPVDGTLLWLADAAACARLPYVPTD